MNTAHTLGKTHKHSPGHIAGYLAGVLLENPFVQAAVGLLVYGGIAFGLMFTAAGQSITADLLAVIISILNIAADLTGLPRIDLGGGWFDGDNARKAFALYVSE